MEATDEALTNLSTLPQPEYVVTLANLLREELNGQPEQVVVYNQEWDIPPTGDWFIAVAFVNGTPYGQSKTYRATAEGLTEFQSQNVREMYSIMLFSSSDLARKLKQEILFAMNSDRSERFQGLYNFKIANLPTNFQDVSAVEATARLNRYDLDFNILVSYSRSRATPYFNKFTTSPAILVNP